MRERSNPGAERWKRLRELARQTAEEKHSRMKGFALGHEHPFDTCPHPDCVLVRSSVPVQPEAGTTLADLEIKWRKRAEWLSDNCRGDYYPQDAMWECAEDLKALRSASLRETAPPTRSEADDINRRCRTCAERLERFGPARVTASVDADLLLEAASLIRGYSQSILLAALPNTASSPAPPETQP